MMQSPATRPPDDRQHGHRFTGAAIMLAAALVFAVMGMLIKLLGPGFRVWDIAAFRFGGGMALILVIFGRQIKLFAPVRPKLMITRGIVGAMAFLIFISALRLIPFSTATVIFFSFPAFAALFSPLIFKTPITRFEVACIGMALTGVAVLLDFSLQGNGLGQVLALLAGALAGLTITLVKTLRASNGPVIIYFYLCLVGFGVTLPPFMADPHWPVAPLEIVIVIAIITLATAGQLFMNQGFHYCQSWEGGLYMTSEVVFATLLGVMFFSENLTGRFWLGGGLIFLSAIAFNLRSVESFGKSSKDKILPEKAPRR